METYLSKRKSLRGVVLILDIRRVPVDEDRQMLEWLGSYGIQPILVITKCDKVSKNEKARQTAIIASGLGVPKEEFCFFSALSREGIEQVWERIEQALAPYCDEPQSV